DARAAGADGRFGGAEGVVPEGGSRAARERVGVGEVAFARGEVGGEGRVPEGEGGVDGGGGAGELVVGVLDDVHVDFARADGQLRGEVSVVDELAEDVRGDVLVLAAG